MQCEIRGLGDMAEAAKGSDTLPKPGRVTEVCREWLVKEDGALAYRLQNEEIKQHYTGNKCRNAQVREDFPCAVDEQKKEEEEAAAVQAMYTQMVLQQEEIDSRVAKQLADRIEREEHEKRRAVEEEDEEIARKLQERERLKIERRERERLELEMRNPVINAVDPLSLQYHHDINNVGLPLVPECNQLVSRIDCNQLVTRIDGNQSITRIDPLTQQLRLCNLNEIPVQRENFQNAEELYAFPGSSTANPPSPPAISEEEARRLQEEQDAEFARLLQEQEGLREGSMLDQDRLMAIEAQDKELARLLQERERAKAKRARERAKQKALLKKQQQTSVLSDDEGFATSPPGLPSPYPLSDWPNQDGDLNRPAVPHSIAIRPTDLDLSSARGSLGRVKQRYPDPEAIEVLPSSSPEPGPSHTLPNIAMAIDPTYPRRATTLTGGAAGSMCNTPSVADTPPSNISSPAISLPPPDFEDDDSPVPPYMPIQGQRRSASLEKKTKKGRVKRDGKDGCKQQ